MLDGYYIETFQNVVFIKIFTEIFISRHHVYKFEDRELLLKEVGPRFEMKGRLYFTPQFATINDNVFSFFIFAN